MKQATVPSSLIQVIGISSVVMIAGMLLFSWLPAMDVEEVRGYTPKERWISHQLPFRQEVNYQSPFAVEVAFRPINPSRFVLRLIPDDCLKAVWLNGEPISLEHWTAKELCDYNSGVLIDVSGLLKQGINSISAELNNLRGGGAGFDIQVSHRDFLRSMYGVACLSLLVAATLLMAGAIGISRTGMVILSIAILLKYWYWTYTPPDVRTYDVYEGGGHLDYIKYIAENLSFPNPSEGWEFHQPPGYYTIAAMVFSASGILAPHAQLITLQLFSFLLFAVFMVFGAGTLEYLHKNWARSFATAILCLWPSGIIHGVRIGNDVAAYALSAIALFYLVKWYEERRNHLLVWASIITAVGLMTKATTVSIAITLVATVAFVFLRQRKWPAMSMVATVVLPLFFAMLISYGDNLYFHASGQAEDWLVGSVPVNLNTNLFVANKVANYLYFDLSAFLRFPFVSTYVDEGGRQFFFNFLLKSSLFSEFNIDSVFHAEVASGLSAVFLVIILACLIRLVMLSNKELAACFPLVLLLFVSVLLLIAYRIKVPSASNTDFRYIYPCVFSLASFFALTLESSWEARYPIIRFGLAGVGVLFVVLTGAFFICDPAWVLTPP